jgi:two-component system chemotaxis response regulator CheB
VRSIPVAMARPSIIAIGASAGGVEALRFLASALPVTLSAPVLVVLHIGAHRSELPDLLNSAGSILAKHAEDGEVICPGQIYIAPPDRHMIVADGRLRLTRGPKENWARPAIDPLFKSAAEAFGPNVAGVILTGRLNDGTAGLFEIKRRGGVAVVQDPREAICSDMPSSAAAHVALDYCIPLSEIPKLLVELVDGKEAKDVAMANPLSQRNEQKSEATSAEHFDRPLTITCPDCGGALRKSETGSIVKFACHIGHTYTAEIMAMAQFEDMEKILRSAVRCLNERAEFCRLMAEDAPAASPDHAAGWGAAHKQALDRAYQLRDFVEQSWITPEPSRQPALAEEVRKS